MADPDPTKDRIPIWLVWGMDYGDVVTLRVITGSHALAMEYRKHLAMEPKTVRAFIESRELNHAFGESLQLRIARAAPTPSPSNEGTG